MDCFNDALATFLSFDRVRIFAVYTGSESSRNSSKYLVSKFRRRTKVLQVWNNKGWVKWHNFNFRVNPAFKKITIEKSNSEQLLSNKTILWGEDYELVIKMKIFRRKWSELFSFIIVSISKTFDPGCSGRTIHAVEVALDKYACWMGVITVLGAHWPNGLITLNV